MVRLAGFVLILLSTSSCDAQQPPETLDTTLLVLRDGRPVEISNTLQQALIAEMLGTLQATGHESTASAGSEDQWRRQAATGSYLLLQYADARRVMAFGDREYVATEIQIPMAGHYLVRNAASGTYWAFTKFRPVERAKLLCRPELLVEENKQFCEDMARVGG